MNEGALFRWLKLARCKGIRRETLKTVADLFDDVDAIFDEFQKRLVSTSRHGVAIFPDDDDVKKELDLVHSNNAEIISIKDPDYPFLLKDMFQAPIVLTVKGNKKLLNGRNFGVVGSRVPCISSIKFTQKTVADLTKADFNIVSGLANGIDTVAHKANLAVKNPSSSTIGVIGNGISKIYPPENKNLYNQIVEEGGLLVSDFEFNAPPISHHFPQRNAIIGCISYGILVVEAKRSSGSLITAKYANSFGREVYAVPGFPDDERFLGSNDLIKKNCAKIINSSEDILSDTTHLFTTTVKDSQEQNGFDFNSVDSDTDLSPESILSLKKKILSLLSSTPIDKASIVVFVQRQAREVEVALLELELEDRVARSFDGAFFKVVQ